ncbi:tRNA (cytidine(34)-2'-O)-methyltransferase [Helicobacter aurati]|uniref:Putative tRNA (cytidine(34)-2'-O)-methyltransferase n=1 Tax=Helicobacter aurati TaxID=137778 RepID=A0A3D8J980_9HELI|nr:tRNA (cytidine(34)-2'-O)-methyltransferase [Helicobacter aurati]RDU73401.1 tRNA (cytidine(34)-2'-O)-methyltransferase [Helicobacter aurati]
MFAQDSIALHIVLVNPQIPQNTGNIARLCAAMNATLHLIHPLGFSLESKFVRRAGLDYWDKLNVKEYESTKAFFAALDAQYFSLAHELESKPTFSSLHFAFSSKVNTSYFMQDFFAMQKSSQCIKSFHYFLYFGSETNGLNDCFQSCFSLIRGKYLTIPMAKDCRCLNLSNVVAIVGYELIRQAHIYLAAKNL